MMLRRFAHSLREQNWAAIAIEFVLLVAGVFLGIQVANWNQDREDSIRAGRIAAALQRDLADEAVVGPMIDKSISALFADYDAARARGEQPPPVYFRVIGSDTPPKSPCSGMLQAQIADLVDPQLLWELCFYYDERDGIGIRYIRYVTFVEAEILPRLHGDPSAFYDADGKLRPEFAASADRLRDWQHEFPRMSAWAACLKDRLNNPSVPGRSCRPKVIGGSGERPVSAQGSP
ncbi:MAG: hypothetical protein LH470_04820 [Lysobacter sp.]|nr:hypothetical protein [Lysobacter sp.]